MLWLKVAAAVIEIAIGLTLLGLGIANVNIASFVHDVAMRELQQDPGDFLARHVLVWFPLLTRWHEVVDGSLLALYGALKGGVVLAVLRRHHRVAYIGAVLFTLIALGAAFVLLRHPSPVRAVVGGLDVAVAFVMVREAVAIRRKLA